MKQIAIYLSVLFFLPSFLAGQKIISIKINGAINPASADFIHSSIEKAGKEKAECLVIHLNTPGGLVTSTRVIVSDILQSPVPVIVYVSPGGAHAGSAGVFITLAADIAAMAPGTNIGAAHPVVLQGTIDSVMNEKGTNDAAAFIRTIAEKRKRNIEWAEDAVRNSVSITENEALNKKVIDLIANNEQDLLNQVDGKKIELASGTKILQTKNAAIESSEMGFFEKILDMLSDPNLVYILMMLGFYGILFELYSPGAILPGIVGVICIIIALYAMQTLPVNYAGLALIIFAIILFLLEIKIISHGLLAIGGVVSLLLGSVMLFRSSSTLDIVNISWSVIITSTVVTASFFLFVVGMGLKAQRSKAVTGSDALIGETGESLSLIDPVGTVWVHGESWNAESVSGKISQGQKIRVNGIKDLTLLVEQLNNTTSS
jgi:membrane-bound serine protease (ClpP class)